MDVMQFITIFVGAAIMLAIGTAILGSADFVDCSDLTIGQNDSAGTGNWQKACRDLQGQTTDSYELLGIILIVVAAVAILAVVRLL